MYFSGCNKDYYYYTFPNVFFVRTQCHLEHTRHVLIQICWLYSGYNGGVLFCFKVSRRPPEEMIGSCAPVCARWAPPWPPAAPQQRFHRLLVSWRSTCSISKPSTSSCRPSLAYASSTNRHAYTSHSRACSTPIYSVWHSFAVCTNTNPILPLKNQSIVAHYAFSVHSKRLEHDIRLLR